MAAPFGFSAGDFIAAIKLTQQTTQALRKSVGAAAHFQQTLVDLGTLESILRRVSTLTPETASAATVQSVHLCSLAIRVPLKRFEHEIRKFEPYLTWPSEHAKRPASDFLVGAGRKIQWTVAVVEEVAKLKASIAPQLAAIELHLQLEALERESVREKDYVQMLARVEAIHCKLDGLTALARDKVLSDDNARPYLELFRVPPNVYTTQHSRMQPPGQQARLEGCRQKSDSLPLDSKPTFWHILWIMCVPCARSVRKS